MSVTERAADALGQAQRERQRVGVVPGDLDEGLVGHRIAPHRRHAAHAVGQRRFGIDAGQPHGVAVLAVGIGGRAGGRARQRLEHQHVAGAQAQPVGVVVAQEACVAPRQAALVVAPGVEAMRVVRGVERERVQQLEDLRRRPSSAACARVGARCSRARPGTPVSSSVPPRPVVGSQPGKRQRRRPPSASKATQARALQPSCKA